MLLYGKPVASHLFDATKEYIDKNKLTGSTVQFFLLSENEPSRVYVRLKVKKAESLGLEGVVYENPTASVDDVLKEIESCNRDEKCIGIIIQLPLASHLQEDQAKILSAVSPKKDLDGLGGVLFGQHSVGLGGFIPATPKAVIETLKYYQLDDLAGKTVMLLGQSNLTGKPLAVELMNRGATVCSFNVDSDQELIQYTAKQADIIVSATGHVHLINEDFFGDIEENVLAEKVLIDVGRGIKDGKAVGDIDWTYFEGKVKAITPVPGGIGPVTVASLFHNIACI